MRFLVIMCVVVLVISGCGEKRFGIDTYTLVVPPGSDVGLEAKVNSKPKEVVVQVPDPVVLEHNIALESQVAELTDQLELMDKELVRLETTLALALATTPVEPTEPVEPTKPIKYKRMSFHHSGKAPASDGGTVLMLCPGDRPNFDSCHAGSVRLPKHANEDDGRQLYWNMRVATTADIICKKGNESYLFPGGNMVRGECW